MTETELIELGLYDPEADDAAERLELLRMAFECGATVEEVRQAIDEFRLHAIPVVREIEGGSERLSLEEVAGRAGIDLETARRFWRVVGLPDPEPGQLVCTERDVSAFQLLSGLYELVSEDAAFTFARAIGASMARLADSEVAAVRSFSEAPLRTAGGGNVEVALELVRAARELLPGTLGLLDAVHRHHLSVAARRYSLWGTRPTEHSTTEAVVGFADLVGSTMIATHLDTAELDALIRRFEDRALEATRRAETRLVKMIGDEAMFVAGSAVEAVHIVEHLRADPTLPPMRAGLAAGTVVVREGDLFGPVVNLAARLASLAEPGQTLLDGGAALRLGLDKVKALGPRSIAGIEDPVEVYALV